jgi:hypothetical protein
MPAKRTRPAKPSAERWLVLDDLAMELHQRPVYVPIPATVRTEEDMEKFTRKVFKDFMRLPYYNWYHSMSDVVIDGFMTRGTLVFPDISK